MELTIVLSDLAPDDSLAGEFLLGVFALFLFLLRGEPLVDVDVQVLHTCVTQHKHEREQNQREVRLWSRHQHEERAIFIGGGEGVGDDSEAQDVEEGAAQYEEQLVEADQERRNHDFHVRHDHECHKDKFAGHVDAAVLSSLVGCVERIVGQEKDQGALPEGVEDPAPENDLVEALVFDADAVELGSAQEYLLGVLVVESGEPDDGQRREAHVEEHIKHTVVDLRA